MIKERFIKDTLENLRESHGTLEELKQVKSQVIHDFGSVKNWIDTLEESFRLYTEELRKHKNK